MSGDDLRAALSRDDAASDSGDFDVAHEICEDDAVLENLQPGERIRGRQRNRHHL